MALDQVSALLQETVKTALVVSAPFLAAAMVMGLVVSIFQAATQINEQTLTFVPKIVIVLGTFSLLFPWIMGTVVEFAGHLLARIASGGGP
jgi:flagellar biosynthetic protein FliQ